MRNFVLGVYQDFAGIGIWKRALPIGEQRQGWLEEGHLVEGGKVAGESGVGGGSGEMAGGRAGGVVEGTRVGRGAVLDWKRC